MTTPSPEGRGGHGQNTAKASAPWCWHYRFCWSQSGRGHMFQGVQAWDTWPPCSPSSKRGRKLVLAGHVAVGAGLGPTAPQAGREGGASSTLRAKPPHCSAERGAGWPAFCAPASPGLGFPICSAKATQCLRSSLGSLLSLSRHPEFSLDPGGFHILLNILCWLQHVLTPHPPCGEMLGQGCVWARPLWEGAGCQPTRCREECVRLRSRQGLWGTAE